MNEDASTESEVYPDGQALADIYSFLALTMRYPDVTQASEAFLEGMATLLQTLEWQSEAEALDSWLTESKHRLESLQLEYTRLFINAVPHVIAPPYASVFLDGDGSVQGKSTEATHNFYRQCGFDLNDTTEPADHIQHELAFLAALVRDGRYEDEQYFLTRFFRPWFALFCSKLLQETVHPFYRVAVQLIDFFTKEEQ